MQPSKVQAQPLLEDIAPIGTRFPTDRLVYPLTISRAGSRQKTGLLLVLLTETPIRCDQLPETRLAPRQALRRAGGSL